MFLFAKIISGLAEETHPPAVIEDLFAAPLPAATNALPKLVPALDVKAYRIEGNTVLAPQAFGMLSNYTGKMDVTRVREGLDKLQSLYRESGHAGITVTLPEQKFTNGLVRVKIVQAGAETGSDLAADITNFFIAPESRKPTIDVRGYLVEGNTALPVAEFNFLTNYIGEVDFAHIREGLGKLQLRYRDLGFPTISVTLPQQKLTNGIVRVKVIEGKISDIVVTGNGYYSAENIRRALPSLTTNILINTKWFQPELDRANLSQDRQIYPVIAPGLEPGTTELTLKVKDEFPLHGHMEINDYSTPNTPLLRLDTALQYDNLWQRDHQVGIDYNFSPQEMKSGSYNFYDEPMVASYSGYYRLPLGFGQGLRENYDNLPVNFGYDEATHRFNLPPATGNPDLIFFASRANSDTPVLFGPLKVIYDNPTNQLAKIYQQSAQHSPTINDDAGTRLTVPLRDFFGINSSVQFGFDYKSYQAQNYSTNLTYFRLYAVNPDDPTQVILVTNQTIRLPNNSQNNLYYLPISLRWGGTRPDKTGSTSLNVSENIFLQALASERSDFQAVAGSQQAGGNYTTINAGLVRLQNLPENWSALFNANGQWASEPLISNEQFALGGVNGVRGYQTGANYGDTGWRTQFDLRAPAVEVGHFPLPQGDVPAYLRCSAFMDYGEVYYLDSTVAAIPQWGTGLGFYLTAGGHLDARLTVAYALLATPTAPLGNIEAYFSVGYQF
jgi:hemolysin activation/secretion protein